MTPRQADLALLLESVEGVLDVFAIDPRQRVADNFDFAVRLTSGGRALAVVPYALLQILTHAECTRVFFFADRLPPGVAGAVRRIALSGPERDDARKRAAARPAPEPVHENRSMVSIPVSEPELLVLGDRRCGGRCAGARVRRGLGERSAGGRGETSARPRPVRGTVGIRRGRPARASPAADREEGARARASVGGGRRPLAAPGDRKDPHETARGLAALQPHRECVDNDPAQRAGSRARGRVVAW